MSGQVCPASRRPVGEVGGNAATNAGLTSRKRAELEAVRSVESDMIRGPVRFVARHSGTVESRKEAPLRKRTRTCDAAARAHRSAIDNHRHAARDGARMHMRI